MANIIITTLSIISSNFKIYLFGFCYRLNINLLCMYLCSKVILIYFVKLLNGSNITLCIYILYTLDMHIHKIFYLLFLHNLKVTRKWWKNIFLYNTTKYYMYIFSSCYYKVLYLKNNKVHTFKQQAIAILGCPWKSLNRRFHDSLIKAFPLYW